VVAGKDNKRWKGNVRRLGINGILMLDETGRFVEMFDGLVIGVNSFFGPGNHYWRFEVTVPKRNLIPHSQRSSSYKKSSQSSSFHWERICVITNRGIMVYK